MPCKLYYVKARVRCLKFALFRSGPFFSVYSVSRWPCYDKETGNKVMPSLTSVQALGDWAHTPAKSVIGLHIVKSFTNCTPFHEETSTIWTIQCRQSINHSSLWEYLNEVTSLRCTVRAKYNSRFWRASGFQLRVWIQSAAWCPS